MAVPDTQLFRDVFSASPIGIAVDNLDGQPLFVNPAFCSMLGYHAEELSNKHWVDLSPPEDAKKDWVLFQQLRAGAIEHYQLEKRYFRRDGSLIWGYLSVSLLKSTPPLIVAMVEDITEKKAAEEARFRHAAIVESSEDAIISKNPDGIITSWNAGAERLFGYTAAEAVGQPIMILIPRELRDEENRILTLLKAGGRIEHFETIRLTKAGGRVDVSLTISPVKDSTGRIVGFSKIARDVTKRKRAENVLRESEQRFHLAAEAGKMYSYEWDVIADRVVRSPEHVKILGLTEPLRFGHQQFMERIHPDDRSKFSAAIAELTPENPTGILTYRVLVPGNDPVWLRSGARALFNDQGRMLRVIGMVADVTDQKLAEEALRASEERLRLAQHAARIGTFELNIRADVNTWTPELEAMYGLSPGTFGGTHAAFEKLIHPDDLPPLQELFESSWRSGQPAKAEWRVVWPDGSVHWIAGRWQTLMDAAGAPSRVIGVNVDVTERKQAEAILLETNRALENQTAELRTREELLKIFVKNVPAGVAMLDREMRYLQVSDRWCADYLGSDSSQVIGRSHYEIFPDMPDRWKEVHRRALAGETVRDAEDRWESQGSLRWASWEVRPWLDHDGNPGGILIFAEDITRRKKMEEALSEMSRKLMEAEERERARIGRELHDDIGQRLTMLSLELEQLREDPSDLESRMRELQKQTVEISNDVQGLSHELHSSKLEYLGVFAGIRSWCREFAERHRIEVDFKAEVRTVLPFDVGLCLLRVLQEAFHNCIKHSGVKRVEVQLAEQANEVLLTVHDSGRGFDIEAARRERGLGLTSMQERVRLVNGTFAIQSRPMSGTTIHVHLPLGPQAASQPAAG
ncbi:MAG TPA: PAS domain S-box protein [Candidatus Angelobacter sp.]|nr:PAS domain S-box protein [Candidatus Angelobacter sp.]